MTATQEQIEMVKAVVAKRRCMQPWHADYVAMLAALDALLREREELRQELEVEEAHNSCIGDLVRQRDEAEAKLAEAQREIERLREEGARDLADMRKFQREFMAADHRVRELEAEVARLTQCIRERDAARAEAVGDQRGHWCSAHGVYCAALSAKVELEAQLQSRLMPLKEYQAMCEGILAQRTEQISDYYEAQLQAEREKARRADEMRGEALHALGLMQNERDAAESHIAGATRISDSEMLALLRRRAKYADSLERQLAASEEARKRAEERVDFYEKGDREQYERRINALLDESGHNRQRAEAAEAQLTRLREGLRNLFVNHSRPADNGDWACAECRPQSDMIRKGFRCAYHEAAALLAEADKGGSNGR